MGWFNIHNKGSYKWNCRFPSCCAEFKIHPSAQKRILGQSVLEAKQKIRISVGNFWASASFLSTALNHTTTQNLEWLNFQFLIQQQNWNKFHLYSIRTLCGYFQPLKFNAWTEGNWKLAPQTCKIQLSKIQNAASTHRFSCGGSTQRLLRTKI